MKFENIIIENRVKNSLITKKILEKHSFEKKRFISSFKDIVSFLNFENSVKSQKKDLIIAKNAGTFIKPCARDKENINTNEYFLYLFSGCPMDCQYCYLQDYLDVHTPIVFANRGMFYRQAKDHLASEKNIILHAGETCDPFAMERISPYLQELIAFFIPRTKIHLEIRSKTMPPSSFYEYRGAPHILISQTLSPEEDIESFEKGTSNLTRRIQFLKRAKEMGFSIGLRFDPIINRENTLESYAKLFKYIFDQIPPDDITSISLGALRFTKNLFRIARLRFPMSHLTASEWTLSSHQKIKYFLPIRIRLYTGLVSLLKEYIKKDFPKRVSFCMDREIEKKVISDK